MWRILAITAVACVNLFAQEWNWVQVGTPSVSVLKAIKTATGKIVAATPDGIAVLLSDNTWSSPACGGLPIHDMIAGNGDTVFVAQGFGTYSDGVKMVDVTQIGDFVDNSRQVAYFANPERMTFVGDTLAVCGASTGISWFVRPSSDANTVFWQSVRTGAVPGFSMGVEGPECSLLQTVGEPFMGTGQLIAGGGDFGPMSGAGSILRWDSDSLHRLFSVTPVAASRGRTQVWQPQLAISTLTNEILVAEWDNGLDLVMAESVPDTTVSGIHWRTLSGIPGNASLPIYGLAHLWGDGYMTPDKLLASCQSGVFETLADSAKEWTSLGALPEGFPAGLVAGTGGGGILPDQVRIYAVSSTQKLFGLTYTSAIGTGAAVVNALHVDCRGSGLSFSNSAGIRCEIYRPSGARIGARFMPPGVSKIDINEFGIAAGVYFVKLQGAGALATIPVAVP